jgi:TonB-linked SusC/RagA family outer membrane protein
MASPKLLAPFLHLALLLSGISVHCQQSSHRISLSEKNVSLEKILDTLEIMTGYHHFGETELLQKARKVSISVKNASLVQVLDICFRDQPFLTYDTVGKNISVRYRELEDNRVYGKIVNEKNEPVPGVTIMVKGTRVSATSNENGEFSIRLSELEAGLVISSVNYETQELKMMAGKDTIVQMRPRVIALSEVSVYHTGYQNIPRERATGSFGMIDNDLLNRRVSTNILDRLDGVTGSVLFNKNAVFGTNQSTISVRGRSTIFANPEPLIVVDNFPYNGNIYNINPDDIETVTVLKDAAAASIWGAFAGNGVIVITTKRGRFNQEPRLEFNTSLTVGRKPDVYAQPVLSTGDYINVEDSLFNHSFYDGAFSNPLTLVLPPVAEILIAEQEGRLTAAEANAQINTLRGQDIRQDLARYFYRNSLSRQYSLNLSGGSSNNQYYLSAGYDKNLSGMARNEYDRVTLNGNNTYVLIPKKLDLTTGFAFAASTFKNNNSGSIPVIYPYLRLADAKGNAMPAPILYSQSYVDTAGGGQLLDWNYRPLDELRNADNVTKLSDYRINIRIHYSILKGLDASAYYQYSKGSSELRNFQGQQTFVTRNLINEYTQLNSGSVIQPIPLGGILDQNDSGYQANNVRLQLNSDHNFTSGSLSIIAGTELRDIENQYQTSRLYGYDIDRHTSASVNYAILYPQYTTGDLLQIPNPHSSVTMSDHYLSYYFNGSYNLQQKYIFSASIRKDESNIFGVRANQKGVPLWSAGAAWELSRESFYHVDSWLPFLKLRLTDGYNGNVDKSVSAYTTAFINSPSLSYNVPTVTIINPPNPSLQWEKIHIVNAGVDFSTRNNRVDGSLEYYIKTGEDLIGPSPLDPTTGNIQYTGNTAAMRTHGLDITLRTKSDLGPIHWSTAFLFSYTRDRVTSYSLHQTTIPDYFTPYLINPLEGKPLYSIYALKWMGLDPQNGDPQGLLGGHTSKDYYSLVNSPDLENLQYVGPANPPIFGSLRNSFSWRQFGFSFNIVYKFGYYFRRSSIDYNSLFNGGSAGHPDFDKRWQMPGDEKRTNVPSMVFPADPLRDQFYSYSEMLIEKGDHIRLQDIQISYDLPRQALTKLPIQSIRFYLYANNIGILWRANHKGIDPDYSVPTNIPNPQTRSLAIGLKMDL